MARLTRIAFRSPFAWPAGPAFRLFASFSQPLRRPATALATAMGKAFQVHDGVNDEFSFGAEFAKDSVHIHGCGSFRWWNHTDRTAYTDE